MELKQAVKILTEYINCVRDFEKYDEEKYLAIEVVLKELNRLQSKKGKAKTKGIITDQISIDEITKK